MIIHEYSLTSEPVVRDNKTRDELKVLLNLREGTSELES